MDRVIYYLASIIAVVFVFSPHEFAHAFVAYKNGDATAKLQGRLTLNPFKHLDPVGFLLCAAAGFGWAKPVPIDPYNFKSYKRGMFTTAIAGVVTNYIIAFISYLIYVLIIRFLMPFAFESELVYYIYSFFQTTFYLIFAYSLYSFVFNLLPLFPLDGFRVVEAFTRQVNPVQKFLRNNGQMILIILIIESFICGIIIDYVPVQYGEIIKYFDILGFYVSWFARNIIGFPITAAWGWILNV